MDSDTVSTSSTPEDMVVQVGFSYVTFISLDNIWQFSFSSDEVFFIVFNMT